MKYDSILIGLLSAMMVSCSINELTSPEQDIYNQSPNVVYAVIEDESGDVDTKVYADSKLRVLWNEDDYISYFAKTTYNGQYIFLGEDGDNAGSFAEVPNSNPHTGNEVSYHYAVYPYQLKTSLSNDEIIRFTLPAKQAYKKDSFGIGANTMASKTATNELKFKNVGGYLSFKFYGEGVSVSSITLRGNNGEKLAGKCTIDMSSGEPAVIMDQEKATEEITLTCDPPVALNASSTDYVEFWMVVPPTTFSKGITFTVTTPDGGVWEKQTTASFSLTRNVKRSLPALEVEPIASYIDEYGVNYGPGITIDGITWAPVNCGYKPETYDNKGYPYGKLYQWGRSNGQGYGYPYDSSNDSYEDDSTPSIENGWRFENGAEDVNTFYTPNGGYFDWDWINDGSAKYWRQPDGNKTEHDPCPTGWRVPTWNELNTLYSGYNSGWTQYNGQYGIWFSGSKPYGEDLNKIFLPASGERYPYSNAQNRGVDGFYWSSSVINYYSWSMKVDSGGAGKWYMGKAYGLSVRCVKDIKPKDVYVSTDYSLDGHVSLIQQATTGNGVDLVIIGDAFADKDQDRFIHYANIAKDSLFVEEPFASMKERFNVYAVNSVSDNDNVDGSTRFLTGFMSGTQMQGDVTHIFSFVREHLPQVDLTRAPICVIVNDTRYAGYCNWWSDNRALCYVPLCNNLNVFSGTFKHEFGGHAFGKLLDEYYYSGTIPSSLVETRRNWRNMAYGFYANVDYTNNPNQIQWAHFLFDERYSGLVGIYEGADTYQYGAYRPTEQSLMRNNTLNTGGYNAPSREAIYTKIMLFSEDIGWTYDYETFVEFDSPARVKDTRRVNSKNRKILYNQDNEPLKPPKFYDNAVSAGESIEGHAGKKYFDISN